MEIIGSSFVSLKKKKSSSFEVTKQGRYRHNIKLMIALNLWSKWFVGENKEKHTTPHQEVRTIHDPSP
jgi:hypothetical protein